MSNKNCIYPMGTYQADTTTVCVICETAGTSGNTYWFRGDTYKICDKHNVLDVFQPIPASKPLTICPGKCDHGTLKCRWPGKNSTADDIVSDDDKN